MHWNPCKGAKPANAPGDYMHSSAKFFPNSATMSLVVTQEAGKETFSKVNTKLMRRNLCVHWYVIYYCRGIAAAYLTITL